jgi:aspartate/methionine/tyrosine aminotransferase
LRLIEPQGAFFVYADVSGYGTDWDVATALLSAGVITVPSTGPGAGFGQAGAGFIRLSYACGTGDIEAGAARIREAAGRLAAQGQPVK